MTTEETLKRYARLKEQHCGCLLLFRNGDKWECYDDDAHAVAETLGLPMRRLQGTGTRYTEFTYHALDTYLPRLIRHGLRVAICASPDDSTARQGITETVTPEKQVI